MVRKKTGETCTLDGAYVFDGYLDGTRTPSPTANEKVIPMRTGAKFPPVNSQDKAAWWRWYAA